MSSSIRDQRLASEYNEIRRLRSDIITWEPLSDRKPPDGYIITFNIRSIVDMQPDGQPIYHRGYDVVIKYPSSFPRSRPDVRFADNKPFPLHPNVWADRKICLEGSQGWIAGVGVPILSLIEMIGNIIAFREVNFGSPARFNALLKLWVDKNLHFVSSSRVSNPVDSSPLRLTDASDAIEFGDEDISHTLPNSGIEFG